MFGDLFPHKKIFKLTLDFIVSQIKTIAFANRCNFITSINAFVNGKTENVRSGLCAIYINNISLV